jgi:hypothetical protein
MEATIPNIILTRYLYIKEDVWVSIMMSCLNRDIKQTMFWVCEMYHSGFEKELGEYIISIYNEFYHSSNPKLGSFLYKMLGRITEGAHIAATMVMNLMTKPRTYIVRDFDTPNTNIELDQNETRIIIHVTPESLIKYDTIIKTNELPARKILKQGCLYPTCKTMMGLFKTSHCNMSVDELGNIHRTDEHWLYYASFSPIWMKRINEYNGSFDHEKCRVYFTDDSNLEEFYANFGYEPDEQCIEVISKMMHLIREPQLDMNAFCRLFNKTKILRRKRAK